jgi:hypothetical protein
MATSEKHRADEDLVSDLTAVIDILPRLVRGRHFHHHDGVKGIEVSIGPAKGDDQGPEVVYCKVSITGGTSAERDKILGKVKKALGEGWTCTNTGDTTAECTNP